MCNYGFQCAMRLILEYYWSDMDVRMFKSEENLLI
jgi:hypothetical protein